MKPSPTHNQEPLMVALRVRPMNTAESRTGARKIAFAVDKNLVVLMDPNDESEVDVLRANRSREKKYVFDRVFDHEVTQQEIYNDTIKAKRVVERVLNGFNCTVFAYGATGTGKTHTMMGTDNEPGIMMRTLTDLYEKIEETKEEMMYRIFVSYVEIYNETVRDLLKDSSESVLDLRDDSKGEVIISGLVDKETNSASEIIALLTLGNMRRTSEPTFANRTSSRSHALLKLSVEQRSTAMNVRQEVKTSVLFMVDLAGSERAAVTQNRGLRMIEGAHINRSLLALANCINALTTGHQHFVNYRDSKLTRLLKEALGGNCMTVMIAHISPASSVYEESRNTLVYAERGKRIKNKTRQNVVDVNYHVTQYQHIIDTLNSRVEQLQRELDRQSFSQDLEVTRLYEQLKAQSQEEKEIRKEILMLEYYLLQNAVECQKHLASIKEWEQHCLSLSNLPPTLTKRPATKHHDPPILDSANEESLTEEQFSDAYIDSSESPSRANDNTESSYSRACSPQDHHKSSVKNTPSKLFLPAPRAMGTLEDSVTTPDSGTCPEGPCGEEMVTDDNGGSAEMEPLWVTEARQELSMLSGDKQRMEAEHLRLQRKLTESSNRMTRVKEKISTNPGLHPAHKQLVDLLCCSCQTESSAVEHSLAASLMSVQLGHHESLINSLLTHSAELMMLVSMLQEVMGKMSVAVPEDVGSKIKQLTERQRKLRAQVLAEKQMPLLSKKMEIPHLAKLSAKLYSSVTGSKSSIFIDDSIPEGREDAEQALSLNNLQLVSTQQSLQSPITEGLSIYQSLSTTTLTAVSQMIPSFLQLNTSSECKDSTLPHLEPQIKPSLVASPLVTKETKSTVATTTDVSKPLTDSSLSHILQTAALKQKDSKAFVDMDHPKTMLRRKASKTMIASVSKEKAGSPRRTLGRMTSLSTVNSFSASKSKYVVPNSVSCDNKKSLIGVYQSSRRTLKQLPMDRLAAVVKSRQRTEVGMDKADLKHPRVKLQSLHVSSHKPQVSTDSLALLQSSRKLTRVSKPRTTRRPFPITSKVLANNKLANSPYNSPMRAGVHNQEGSPKRNVNRPKYLKNAWK